MKKIFLLIIFISFFFNNYIYKDYKYKESLERNFYLMESEVLPSKYICIKNSDSELILIYDVVEILGNNTEMLVKTNDKGQLTYNLIKINLVKYPEDIEKISSDEFAKRKKIMQYEYSYDDNNGFNRSFRLH